VSALIGTRTGSDRNPAIDGVESLEESGGGSDLGELFDRLCATPFRLARSVL